MDSVGPGSSPPWRIAAATSTAMYGALTIVSALTDDVPWRHDLLLNVEPGPLMAAGHVLALGAGIALLYLARGMLDRRRRALDVTIVLLLLVALLHLVKGLDYEEALVALALAAVLACGRHAFTRASSSRPPILAATIAIGAFAGIYAVACSPLADPKSVHSLTGALSAGASTLASGTWLRADEPARWLVAALLLAAAGGVAFVLRSLLKPQPASDGHTPAEHASALRVIAAHGADSLAPFALREDKAFFFAHGGFLAYRTLRETAVVSGDPVGPPGCAPLILAAFLRHADRQGWRVAVTAASPALAAAAPPLGLRALQVGSEALVDAQGFTLDGRAVRKVRQAVARVVRHGWATEFVRARDLAPADLEDIVALERDFKSTRPRLYGFAMTLGRLWGAPEDEDALYALARDPDGAVGACIRFLPYARGLSLDAVRRRDDIPNGVCEALVVEAIDHARATGCAEVSLNFAGFAHVMAPTAPLRRRERLLRAGLLALHGRFQLERLVVFNNHFQPAWRPRYLLYASSAELPCSAVRVLQAERYIRPPRVTPLKRRWEPAMRPWRQVPQLQRR
jgi:lysyl-tRNA synthetase class 2